jgi:hypothetical protein
VLADKGRGVGVLEVIVWGEAPHQLCMCQLHMSSSTFNLLFDLTSTLHKRLITLLSWLHTFPKVPLEHYNLLSTTQTTSE